MKKTIFLILSLMFMITNVFANINLNKNKLNVLEKQIQNKYGISVDINTTETKIVAEHNSTADILLRINFKWHKMQDFVRWYLSPIFNHSDTDHCRTEIKKNLRKKEFQKSLENYLLCINNSLYDNIQKVINKWKKVGINITTYKLFIVKKELPKIINKEKLVEKQKEKNIASWIWKFIKRIFYIFILIILIKLTIYSYKRYKKIQLIKEKQHLLDEDLIFLNNIKIMNKKELKIEINKKKRELEYIEDLKFSLKLPDIWGIVKSVNDIDKKVTDLVLREKSIKEKMKKNEKRFNDLFNIKS